METLIPITQINILCAGAVQGLVKALQERFKAQTGADIVGRFGAVGAMKEALLADEPCDVLIVTQSMVDALIQNGRLSAGSARPLGHVRTGVAVRSGQPSPDVSTPEGLKAALLAAEGIYFPDPARATAGIHFEKVMRELGILDELQGRLRTYPNGATAMRAMGDSTAPRLLGCTQITEINYTAGVDLVGPLPTRFELATVYTAAISSKAAQPGLAGKLLEWLAGPDSQALRMAGGFEH